MKKCEHSEKTMGIQDYHNTSHLYIYENAFEIVQESHDVLMDKQHENGARIFI